MKKYCILQKLTNFYGIKSQRKTINVKHLTTSPNLDYLRDIDVKLYKIIRTNNNLYLTINLKYLVNLFINKLPIPNINFLRGLLSSTHQQHQQNKINNINNLIYDKHTIHIKPHHINLNDKIFLDINQMKFTKKSFQFKKIDYKILIIYDMFLCNIILQLISQKINNSYGEKIKIIICNSTNDVINNDNVKYIDDIYIYVIILDKWNKYKNQMLSYIKKSNYVMKKINYLNIIKFLEIYFNYYK